ncbi:UDP-glucose:undecaprenyl-phosphate glucose-1-phosphate transferase [Paraburkholderia humisilvae]|uniref:UDP-glucose:undecaprenyl-phosphate glucose-1-phosphate transferase n=2 Tax=Paraburkholderia humisilvae TaxID=627669 RepID=A0A6J5F3U8_9BURK|nr:UDP-glucose:undecaprenyl-phosphate glucose-1-phosphate transferase [Paraburkholderia humisilvae]
MMLLVRRVLIAWISVQTCVWVLMLCLHSTNDAARLWFAYWAGAGSVALAGVRIVTYAVLGRLRHAGLNQRCVALVGDIGHLRRLLLNIEAAPGSGFRPEAVFCPRDDVSGAEIGLRVFMDFEAFVSHVREANVHELWLALPLSDQSTIVRFLGTFREDLINIRLVPDVGGLALFDGGLVELLGSPAINLAASPLSPAALAQKAAFDRVFAIFVLVAGAPIFMAIAVAIKLSSPGPVFFRQRRRGANGRIFSIYKFRSMHVHQQADGGLQQATRADPRITRVGAFLRRTSLDELPQFINVLRGEMSVVGPRPHAIEHDELYGKVIDRYIHRYRIKPGITGWAQVNGYRGETEQVEKMQKRVEHDFYYLCNWSMAFDIKIIATTLLKGFIHRNAY